MDKLNESQKELADLKLLVNRFLDTIFDVPFRAIDCNQELAHELWNELCNKCCDPAEDVKRRYQ